MEFIITQIFGVVVDIVRIPKDNLLGSKRCSLMGIGEQEKEGRYVGWDYFILIIFSSCARNFYLKYLYI